MRPACRCAAAECLITSCPDFGISSRLIAFFGYDINDTASGIVSVEHTAATASNDLDPFNPVKRNKGPVSSAQVSLVDAAAIHQHQRVGLSCFAESTQINLIVTLVARDVFDLNTGLGSKKIRHGGSGRLADFLGR